MRKIGLLLLGVLTLSILAAAPVFAHNGVDHSTGATHSEEEVKLPQSRENRQEKIKQQVQTRRSNIKANVCENRQARLQKAVTNMNQNAPRVLARIDAVYEKVVAYKTNADINIAQYDEYIATIEAAKATAKADVDALVDYNFTVDCSSGAVAEQLDGVRIAAEQTRASLKDYRDTVKGLIKAIREGQAESETSNE